MVPARSNHYRSTVNSKITFPDLSFQIYFAGPLLGGAAGTLVYEKLLSVKAMASTCLGGCWGSSDL